MVLKHGGVTVAVAAAILQTVTASPQQSVHCHRSHEIASLEILISSSSGGHWPKTLALSVLATKFTVPTVNMNSVDYVLRVKLFLMHSICSTCSLLEALRHS